MTHTGLENAGVETLRGVVHPWFCDSMGHMSVQHQMPLLDNAVYHLLGEFGPVTEVVGDRRLGWADVRHEIQYLHELVAGDLLVLRSGLVSVGRSSLRHRTAMVRRSDGRVCTIMEGVTVRFDLDARVSIPLTDEHRARAAGLMLPSLPQSQ
ncbi:MULTISPECIES: acyl-CoA thioesterase [unclassified Sphingomonas]|uniref:acyl-CoA thioesterase n=1 Tax=unclassified Sphingomonas TaxID=196159 RepID=UPI000B131B73|nr:MULTISPECIES: acyl-CoA thioesterase [unclassified Sphingomonas]